MTQEELIEKLATEELEARMTVECLAMANVAGLSWDERKKSAIEYAKARARHFKAMADLSQAIGEINVI